MQSSSRSSRERRSQRSIKQMIESLRNHTVNTLTELRRIERVATTCETEEELQAFQQPMASAWDYYVSSNQLLLEMRGLTRNYPISSSLIEEARVLVSEDPDSSRSWNMAWLCLSKIRDAGLVLSIAQSEAQKPEMWGGRYPSPEEAEQLTQCFVYEWSHAVDTMLRHWRTAPVWY
ncbi:hypothetical protein F5B22DRAFT_319384 [Xylaria bambusicola]|uniref:uncharacterized protein n=1 Tax=Xylaria bambusicola TaxID=326684 RepID=UPI00200824A4|nr:uncharacterized protein F5B22DRAFT_319384 [Xylaria bambusicola]KAI0509623.1 hypothetical protein F5B22DRAFT_319384 [Xylaria bambusicola]